MLTDQKHQAALFFVFLDISYLCLDFFGNGKILKLFGVNSSKIFLVKSLNTLLKKYVI
jgi:hypothetical protein